MFLKENPGRNKEAGTLEDYEAVVVFMSGRGRQVELLVELHSPYCCLLQSCVPLAHAAYSKLLLLFGKAGSWRAGTARELLGTCRPFAAYPLEVYSFEQAVWIVSIFFLLVNSVCIINLVLCEALCLLLNRWNRQQICIRYWFIVISENVTWYKVMPLNSC